MNGGVTAFRPAAGVASSAVQPQAGVSPAAWAYQEDTTGTMTTMINAILPLMVVMMMMGMLMPMMKGFAKGV